MPACQICTARTQTFLCRDHAAELRDMLAGLVHGQRHPNGAYSPGWLELLADAATGQTRMGSGRANTPPALHGDEPIPHDDAKLLDRFLAAGGINARAARVAVSVDARLVSLVRHVEDTRGARFEPQRGNQTVAMAHWLRGHARELADDPAAIEHYFDVKAIVNTIEEVINRPLPWRWCGPCPTWDEKTQTECGHELRCREEAEELRCPKCKQTHNPDLLQLAMIRELLAQQLTIPDILKANRLLPEEWRISERTLRHWRQHDQLQPCGYNDDGDALYLWADIERLKAKKRDTSACRMTPV